MKKKFTHDQLFALRFAPDEELKGLIEKTLLENLSKLILKKQSSIGTVITLELKKITILDPFEVQNFVTLSQHH